MNVAAETHYNNTRKTGFTHIKYNTYFMYKLNIMVNSSINADRAPSTSYVNRVGYKLLVWGARRPSLLLYPLPSMLTKLSQCAQTTASSLGSCGNFHSNICLELGISSIATTSTSDSISKLSSPRQNCFCFIICSYVYAHVLTYMHE